MKVICTSEGQLVQRNLKTPICKKNVIKWINQLEVLNQVAAVVPQALYFVFCDGFKHTITFNIKIKRLKKIRSSCR